MDYARKDAALAGTYTASSRGVKTLRDGCLATDAGIDLPGEPPHVAVLTGGDVLSASVQCGNQRPADGQAVGGFLNPSQRAPRRLPGLIARSAIAFVLVGCAQHAAVDYSALNHAQTNVAGAEALNKMAATQIDAARTDATPVGKAHLDAAAEATAGVAQRLPVIATNLATEQNEKQRLADENLKLSQDNAAMRNDFWSPQQHAIWRKIKFILVGGLVLAIVLRGVALMPALAGGPLGMAASVASHGILAILTCGMSLIITIGENVWFRVIKPKVDSVASTAANQSAAVEATH